MTDSKLVMSIMQNDERAWRYICRNMKLGFISVIRESFSPCKFTSEDLEDVFQDSLIVLMHKVKTGDVVISREGALFSYLAQIGKLSVCNLLRKKRELKPEEVFTISQNLHKEDKDFEISVSEKQKMQNDFLDRAFDSLPDTCKTIFKKFYWERKPLDEIAGIIGYGNEDSVKTKKSRCMKKFKEFANKLLESDEFSEEAIRDTAERSALRELINEEKLFEKTGIVLAALDVKEDTDKDEE